MTTADFNPGHDMQHSTFGDILIERSTDDHPGLLFEDSAWTWREFVAEAAVRAEILRNWADEHAGSYAEEARKRMETEAVEHVLAFLVPEPAR